MRIFLEEAEHANKKAKETAIKKVTRCQFLEYNYSIRLINFLN
jgi:hypothetical protein